MDRHWIAPAAAAHQAAAGTQGSRRSQPYLPPRRGRWKTRAADRRRHVGMALWGDGTQPVVALGGTEAHMRRRRGGERDEACASWLRGLALRCEPLGRRIQGVRAGASCAGSPRGREMAATRARNGGVVRRIGRETLKMELHLNPQPRPQSSATRQPLPTKLGSPLAET